MRVQLQEKLSEGTNTIYGYHEQKLKYVIRRNRQSDMCFLVTNIYGRTLHVAELVQHVPHYEQ